MINDLHARWRRPERGWDPIPASHAEMYTRHIASHLPVGWAGSLEARLGPLAGKTALDLGGGPGVYGLELWRLGMAVTWFDISHRYRALAERRFAEAGATIAMAPLGYLDEAASLLQRQFDLVICGQCWYYCINERRFGRCLAEILTPGGHAYIWSDTQENPRVHARSARLALCGALYRHLGYKIGHPFPPRGRIEEILREQRGLRIEADYSMPGMDQVWIERRRL